MSQPELVKRIAESFTAAGIQYMLTGSVVSSLQGEPRATHDIDVVVSADENMTERFRLCFPSSAFYLDEDAVRSALRERRMFNAIELQEHDKIDVWMLKDDAFERSGFSRRISVQAFGTELVVSAPEDTMLYKLRWLKRLGSSEKQFNDVLRVYEVQKGALNEGYLDQWAQYLGVVDVLAEVRKRAEAIEGS